MKICWDNSGETSGSFRRNCWSSRPRRKRRSTFSAISFHRATAPPPLTTSWTIKVTPSRRDWHKRVSVSSAASADAAHPPTPGTRPRWRPPVPPPGTPTAGGGGAKGLSSQWEGLILSLFPPHLPGNVPRGGVARAPPKCWFARVHEPAAGPAFLCLLRNSPLFFFHHSKHKLVC